MTPWDAEAAGKLGISVIGLTSGGRKADDLRSAGCAEVWQDPADLLLFATEAESHRQLLFQVLLCLAPSGFKVIVAGARL